ncbi:UNVERIFIED_ORG: hypothetical protein HNP28_003566 [Comamonas terrigena]
MSERAVTAEKDHQTYVDEAYAHLSAVFTLLSGAGDTLIPASQMRTLLSPVHANLDKATDD